VYKADGSLWFTMECAGGKVREVSQETPQPSGEEWFESLHRLADRAETHSRCYFIGGDEGCIKIGHSVDVTARLRAIQSCSPIALRVLAIAPGGAEREAAYHTQFDEHRAHGEWFARHPDILAEIDRIATTG
jgi:Meiotically up-regulated gene 113